MALPLSRQKRKFVRIKLQGQEALLNIISFEGKLVDAAKSKPVMLIDISPKGLCFESDLKLPVDNQLKLGFSFQLMNTDCQVQGNPVWRRKNQLWQYGVVFTDTYHQSSLLNLLLKEYVRKACPDSRIVHEMYRRLAAQYEKELRWQIDYRV
ncbi:PilZ domain-containing protein [Ferviditalea candida]|uniref:PilZ domain-containing protein n=1 Tax=Ferviditalea candida TaxID=3108399 RepID=A0ABU5ZIG5_9BACL|nr:PilZ domain-containing protein [Paenibacillaceae bacterium T2]